MWFTFALLAGFFFSTRSLLERYTLKDTGDPLAFSFVFSALSTIIMLPFALTELNLEGSNWELLLLASVGIVVAGQNFFNFSAMKYTTPTVISIITKFRLVWVLVFGLLLAQEIWSPIKGVGVALTILASAILFSHKDDLSAKGIGFAFSSTFFYAASVVIMTPLVIAFGLYTTTLAVFLFPAIVTYLFLKDARARCTKLLKENLWVMILISFMAVAANLTIISAVTTGEATRALVVVEAFIVLVLFGEHFFLKEKKHFFKKGISAALATAGAILIRIVS